MILWKELEFEKAFFDMTAKAHKVDQGMFLKSGGFPIIDQGQTFIAGYSNDDMLVWKRQLPVIIFGDHTRIVKYINFPFILGADGTKVLEINKDLFPLFAYYQLLSHEIPSAGYSRHFKFLKEWVVRFPPYTEQQRIAALLHKADRLRQLRRFSRQLSDGYLQSVFLETFGDPIQNPHNWKKRSIVSMISDLRGGAPLEPEDFLEFGFPVLHKGAIKPAGEILLDDRKNTFTHINFVKEHQHSVIDKTYTAITLRDLVPSGPSIGLISRLENSPHEKYILAQGAYAFHVNKATLSEDYLVWLSNVNSFRKYLRSIAVGSTQIHIRIPIFMEIEIPVPPIEIQKRFSEIAGIYKRNRSLQMESERQAEQLFRSLLDVFFME